MQLLLLKMTSRYLRSVRNFTGGRLRVLSWRWLKMTISKNNIPITKPLLKDETIIVITLQRQSCYWSIFLPLATVSRNTPDTNLAKLSGRSAFRGKESVSIKWIGRWRHSTIPTSPNPYMQIELVCMFDNQKLAYARLHGKCWCETHFRNAGRTERRRFEYLKRSTLTNLWCIDALCLSDIGENVFWNGINRLMPIILNVWRTWIIALIASREHTNAIDTLKFVKLYTTPGRKWSFCRGG